LSVSDIIVINNKAYYCEPVGWRVISFNFKEEYLRWWKIWIKIFL
jgi:hypothetical protein